MNPEVPQYKNCWKWEHITFACCFQDTMYIKFNGLHKVEHHCHFTWCCKTNFKMNPPYFETKQGKLCSHISTARAITKWTQMSVPSDIITSIKNGTPRNIKNSKNLGGS